jgi:hypothetical protein
MARTYMNPGTAHKMKEQVEPKWVETAKDVLAEKNAEVFDPEAAKTTDDPFNNELTSDGYDDMTVVQLKEVLQEEGLSIKGKKADLIARLRMPISDSTEAPTQEVLVEEEQVAPAEAAVADENPEEGVVSESEESSKQEPVIE